ncbi:MAG: hypothetical protein RLY86_702 [Pseudomonadota bacterium]|jgi:hypothetical protein
MSRIRTIAHITLRSTSGTVDILRLTEEGSGSWETLPTDTAPKAWYRPHAARLGNYAASLFSGGRVSGSSSSGRAELLLNNGDGWLDGYEDWTWQRVTILQGPLARFASLNQFAPTYAGQIESVSYDGREVAVRLREGQAAWEAEVPRRLYRGDNVGPVGLEGGPELADTPAPLLLGRVFNAGLVWVNKALLIAQAHDGAVTELLPRERGQLVPVAADVGAAIGQQGLSIPAGQAVTDRARGLVRFGFSPQEPVTADVTVAGGATAADLLTRVAGWLGLSATLDTASMGALRDAAPAPLGMVVDAQATGLSLADAAMASAGGWWLVGPDEKVRAGLLLPPQGLPGPLMTVTAADRDVSVDRVPSSDSWGDGPVWRVEVRYGRNPTRLSEGQIFGAVSGAIRDRLMREWPDTATAEDLAVKAAWPEAGVLSVQTQLAEVADAQALADRLLALHGTWRRRLSITLPQRLYLTTASLGGRVDVVRPDRGAGGPMVVTALTREPGRQLLRVWG